MNRPDKLILASGSSIRRTLLKNANVPFDISLGHIDEQSIKRAMISENASTREIARALADGKAQKVGLENPNALTLGCDQILSFNDTLISKAENKSDARAILKSLKGAEHQLLSAAVIYHQGQPVWHHVGEVHLTMHDFSDTYLDDYLDRNWDSVKEAVGCYKLEEEGVRLFSKIEGDYFNVLGLPLVEILSYLSEKGILKS